jgi:bifunctional non-homologous end joining protein LigD
MPIAWDDLDGLTGPEEFTLATVPGIIAAQDRDPWDGFRRAARTIDPAPRKR